MSPAGESNLLLGILALQMDFISREQLIAATSVWVRDKSRALASILREQHAIDQAVHDLLQALVSKHLELHDGDPQQSLAALSSLGSIQDDLRSLGDEELSQTLPLVAGAKSEDNDRTLSWAAGEVSWAAGEVSAGGARFRVLRPHAKGGLGEVFVAYDREVNREVALKEILRQHADDLRSRARFTLEAEITGRLEHPGIVPVYGLGCYGDGRPFYVMRFIRGENLKTGIQRFHRDNARKSAAETSLEFRKLLGRFVDVCQAIEYAHSRGVLHRDLKPGNIMLGKYGETLVVDWGLAKATGRDERHHATPDETTLVPGLSDSGSAETALGSLVGTKEFMSPEQAEGRLRDLGPASDVYSLGATLYTLLTGQTPFRGETQEVLAQVRQGRFPPPRQIRPEVPRALEAICLKAMALRPDQRYGSAQELAAEIERSLADEAVQAYAEPWLDTARRWTRRHRMTVAAVAALLVTSFVALAVGYVLVRKERNVAQENAAMTRQVVEQFLIRIGDDRWSLLPQFEPLRVEMVDQAVGLYRRLLEQQPRDVSLRFDAALSFRRSANLYRMVNRFDQARQLYRDSAALMEDIRREQPRDEFLANKWVELLSDEADWALRAEGAAAAEPKCREAYEVANQTRTDFPASVAARLGEARAQLSYAEALQQRGRYADAVPMAQAAATTFGELSKELPKDLFCRASTVIAWNNLANMLRAAGQLQPAERAQAQAVERGRANLRHAPAEPNSRFVLAATLVEQGRLYRVQGGRENESRASLDEAVAMLETLTRQSPSTATFARRLADALVARGELGLVTGPASAAVTDARRAVELAEQLEQQSGGVAGYHSLLAFAYTLAGQAEGKLGNNAAARALLAKAQTRLASARQVNPADPQLIEKAAEIESLLREVRSTTDGS